MSELHYHVCDICLESGMILDILFTGDTYKTAEDFINTTDYYGEKDEILVKEYKYPNLRQTDQSYLFKLNNHCIGRAEILTRKRND